MRRRGGLPLLIIAATALAACGSTDTPSADSPPETEAPVATDAPVDTEAPAEPGAPAEPAATDAPIDTEAPAEPADQPVATDAPVDTEAPAVAPATDPPATTEPPGPTWPDDGCSADNSPTTPDVADGPAPAIEVRAESANSPLPDLAVRRINCKGGWENLKNELPADRALLVWAWAPH